MFAAATGIESQNIVGYQNVEIAGGKLSCVALQFADVGGDGDLASIAKLTTTGVTPGVYDTMNTEAPCIMIYNGIGYTYYYYISDAYADGDNEVTVTAWADGNGDEAITATKPLGTGLWLRVPSETCDTGALTQAGQVNDAATTSIDINAGLTLAANPYPTALNLSKVTTAGLTPGVYDTMNEEAPCIMIYNGVGYTYYYYISDAYADGDNEVTVTAWADGNGDAVTKDIAGAGKAFWARSTTAGTLTFSL